MKYVFWAHFMIWLLLSLYMFFLERRLGQTVLRLKKTEEKMKERV